MLKMTGTRQQRSWRRGERGQAIILFVGVFTVIIIIAAITIDFGLWLAERRSVQRAADLAAAAGAQDLLSSDDPFADDTDSLVSADYWAAQNGFQDGVSVTLLCKNSAASPGICTNTNPPGAGPSDCAPGDGCDTIQVEISKPGSLLFASLFGVGGINVGATAAAGVTFGGGGGGGAGAGPDQTVLLIDAQGRMGNSCAFNPPACPIARARDAATGLADLFLGGGGGGLVGYAPYHNCYGPASPFGPGIGCVPDQGPENVVIPLTDDISALHTAIDATVSYQLQPANICMPLLKAWGMFNAQPAGDRVVVLLSDGGNRWQHNHFDHSYPPAACHPETRDPLPPQPVCDGARTAKSELDQKTWQRANDLKTLGAEIYVVALDVCGTDDGRTRLEVGYCAGIGDTAHDNVADQRLLKCVASTPEHYKPVDVYGLQQAFEEIALELATRGLVQ